MPTFDYEPAGSTSALVERTDLVVTGTLASVQRVDGGNASLTQITLGNYEFLTEIDPTIEEEFATNPTLAMATSWAGPGADPIAELRQFGPEDTHVLAFVWAPERGSDLPPESAFFVPDIEGLHISCGPDGLIEPVIVEFPPIDGLSPTDAIGVVDDR